MITIDKGISLFELPIIHSYFHCQADLNITPVEIDGSSVNATSRDYADVNAKPGDSITVTVSQQHDIFKLQVHSKNNLLSIEAEKSEKNNQKKFEHNRITNKKVMNF